MVPTYGQSIKNGHVGFFKSQLSKSLTGPYSMRLSRRIAIKPDTDPGRTNVQIMKIFNLSCKISMFFYDLPDNLWQVRHCSEFIHIRWSLRCNSRTFSLRDSSVTFSFVSPTDYFLDFFWSNRLNPYERISLFSYKIRDGLFCCEVWVLLSS